MSERRAQTAPLVEDTALPRTGQPAVALGGQHGRAQGGLPAIHPVGHTVHQEPREPCKESECIPTPSIICKLTVLYYWSFFPINFYWSIVGFTMSCWLLLYTK